MVEDMVCVVRVEWVGVVRGGGVKESVFVLQRAPAALHHEHDLRFHRRALGCDPVELDYVWVVQLVVVVVDTIHIYAQCVMKKR
jgi:hypothetical protein